MSSNNVRNINSLNPSTKRAYLPWTSNEDILLLRMYRCEIAKHKMAYVFERTTGSISSRIKKLTKSIHK